jgi:hypothetical protein
MDEERYGETEMAMSKVLTTPVLRGTLQMTCMYVCMF